MSGRKAKAASKRGANLKVSAGCRFDEVPQRPGGDTSAASGVCTVASGDLLAPAGAPDLSASASALVDDLAASVVRSPVRVADAMAPGYLDDADGCGFQGEDGEAQAFATAFSNVPGGAVGARNPLDDPEAFED